MSQSAGVERCRHCSLLINPATTRETNNNLVSLSLKNELRNPLERETKKNYLKLSLVTQRVLFFSYYTIYLTRRKLYIGRKHGTHTSNTSDLGNGHEAHMYASKCVVYTQTHPGHTIAQSNKVQCRYRAP